MSATDIAVLVPKAKAGDRDAWAALLESFRPLLARRAKRLIESRYPHRSSSELAQEVIVKLIEMPTLFRDADTPENAYALLRSYLSKAVLNIVLNVIRDERADKRRQPGSPVPANGDSANGPTPDPARPAPVELKLDLAAALQRLVPETRALIVGFHFERRSYDELAERHGLSTAVVHKRLTQARKELGELLREWA